MSDEKFKPTTVAGIRQIADVTNIDQMDSQDRQKLGPRVKLLLLCEEAKAILGRDPRGGGIAFVARPRVLLQLLLEMHELKILKDEIELQRSVIIGADGGDIVGWFQGVPIMVRCNVRDDNLHAVRTEQIPDSKLLDRRRAAELRMSAHGGTLSRLLTQEN